MTSKFEDRLRVLNTARNAEIALQWFNDGPADRLTNISVAATVNYASATSEGKAAQPYIHRAAQSFHTQIVELAKTFAEDDIKRGEEVL